MDPDACLLEIRQLVEEANRRGFKQQEASRLYELVDALDGWISRGGLLPYAWERMSDTPEGAST